MPGSRTFSYVVGAVCALGAGANAQPSTQPSSSERAQVIAASFSKSKHLTKEKRGFRKEKYVDIRSVPAVRESPAAYSGTYDAADLGFSLQLVVGSDGRVEGTGLEPVGMDSGVMRRFTVTNGRIEGALLTADKVYANGQRESFEGVFMNRTSRNSPTDPGTTDFGLGIMGKPVYLSGVTIDKFFYQLKQGGSDR